MLFVVEDEEDYYTTTTGVEQSLLVTISPYFCVILAPPKIFLILS